MVRAPTSVGRVTGRERRHRDDDCLQSTGPSYIEACLVRILPVVGRARRFRDVRSTPAGLERFQRAGGRECKLNRVELAAVHRRRERRGFRLARPWCVKEWNDLDLARPDAEATGDCEDRVRNTSHYWVIRDDPRLAGVGELEEECSSGKSTSLSGPGRVANICEALTSASGALRLDPDRANLPTRKKMRRWEGRPRQPQNRRNLVLPQIKSNDVPPLLL